jgi:formimidoylglutamate deiminase
VRAIIADYVYRGTAFEPGLAILLADEPGPIADVVPAGDLEDTADRALEIVRMPARAIVPGFVNAHSHAFQRLLRGHTQWRPVDSPNADFWSWRDAMYRAALALSPDDIYQVARFCFIEMLRAGYTSVGEFHYLQRAADGAPYAEPNELALRVIAAAEDAGLRICLLNVAYARSGIDQPLAAEQRRFATPDLDAYLAATADLAKTVQDRRLASVGVAPHSVRAVPRGWLAPLHAWAKERDAAFHIHVAEQPAEVDACCAGYGLRPVELLAREGVVGPELAAVHATHLSADEVALLGGARATIVVCPTTERDLGDGMLPAAELIAAGARLALGSDSHTILDPFEEMRLVEYHERLRQLRRIVLGESDNGRLSAAPVLLTAATRAGARALRLHAGAIEADALADFVAIDLQHRALAGWTTASLPAFLAFSAPADIVTDVWVDGVQRVRDRTHDLEEDAMSAFHTLAVPL